ncbi:DNA mismatch repair protein MutS [Candidatus Margulisiibacteriota bacterium]
MSKTEIQTPMVKQYMEIKNKHQDSILFFRLGDFYEMFFEDAEVASKELELTLTGRGKDDRRIPMCGIPYHALDNYLPRLINKGYKVAICEQTEDPTLSKGITKREVVRVVTPGTLMESNMLSEKQNNYLMAISTTTPPQILRSAAQNDVPGNPQPTTNHQPLTTINDKQSTKFGIAIVDASTGEFKVTEVSSKEQLLDEIARFNPVEILMPESLKADLTSHITTYEQTTEQKAEEALRAHFRTKNLEGFGCQKMPLAKVAAFSALDYLNQTQNTTLGHINTISTYYIGEYMVFDNTTRRNLEINKTIRDHSFRGSLLWVLDQTKTSMGGRLLREWVNQPLLNIDKIQARQEAVADLYNDLILREELKSFLKDIYDIERLSARIASGTANARDLVALKESLQILPEIKASLSAATSTLLTEIRNTINSTVDSSTTTPPQILRSAAQNDVTVNHQPTTNHKPLTTNIHNPTPSTQHLVELIDSAIVNDPPLQIKDGGIIKRGFNADLDEVWQITHGGKEWLIELENREKEQTGIKNLKVGFNKVFGYYIEVSKTNVDKVPDNYIRKQTLTTGERFITPELKERETLILNASERMINLEYEIFCEVRSQIARHTRELQHIARQLALLDVLFSLACVAVDNNYTKPQILPAAEHVLQIKDGRHPVIEKTLKDSAFIPNDCAMDQHQERLIVLTGPNMSGKSTYMRQIALIILMAQIGSFVPAAEAVISVADRIFTRVGAMDDIFAGQSTFMVEMTETANILNNATANSFIILDELGRGTSTFDGMSLAWSIAEYIHLKIGAKTVFATHYHELIQMESQYQGVKNYNVAVEDKEGRITFLHRVHPGGADQSYGVHVAQLAGLPPEVLGRAREILAGMESQQAEVMGDKQLRLF